MAVQWRPIAGWGDLYQVSSDGRVRNLKPVPGRWASGILNGTINQGYFRITLRRDGRSERRYLHQLVCEAFHGQAPQGCEVAHNNGDRTDCRASNLRWATRAANILDKATHGTQLRGKEVPTSKLSEEQVLEALRTSELSSRLAVRFGVNPSTISDIRRKKTWRHISAELEAA